MKVRKKEEEIWEELEGERGGDNIKVTSYACMNSSRSKPWVYLSGTQDVAQWKSTHLAHVRSWVQTSYYTQIYHVCMRIFICTYVHAHTHTCAHIHIHIFSCIHTCMHTYIYIHKDEYILNKENNLISFIFIFPHLEPPSSTRLLLDLVGLCNGFWDDQLTFILISSGENLILLA